MGCKGRSGGGVATRYAKENGVMPGRLPTPGSNDLEQTLLTTHHNTATVVTVG